MMISRGKQKKSKKNLLQSHFVHHESHLKSSGIEHRSWDEMTASSRLSYGTTFKELFNNIWILYRVRTWYTILVTSVLTCLVPLVITNFEHRKDSY
jgi:hypothetical protein